MKKKHALITGGAGFIGSHLANKMIERNFEVTVLDNLMLQVHCDDIRDKEGWPLYLNKKIRKIKGDILEPICFEKALEGVTHLVHLAASVGVGQSMANIYHYTKNNTLGGALILETLSKIKHSVERIAVASSMSIYGEGEYFSKKKDKVVWPKPRDTDQFIKKKWELYDGDEQLAPIATTEKKQPMPTSIYAVNKHDHEEMFLIMGKTLNIPTVALRIFNTYGSFQSLTNAYTGVVAIFAARLLNDLPPILFEDGNQMRDFVHVTDVSNAFINVLESDQKVCDVFNVGSGQHIKTYEIAEILSRILKKDIKPEISNLYRKGDIRHCFADISKIEQTFGFKPQVQIEEGMKELIDWIKVCPKPVIWETESITHLLQNDLII